MYIKNYPKSSNILHFEMEEVVKKHRFWDETHRIWDETPPLVVHLDLDALLCALAASGIRKLTTQHI